MRESARLRKVKLMAKTIPLALRASFYNKI
jgi:hypothetical protein